MEKGKRLAENPYSDDGDDIDDACDHFGDGDDDSSYPILHVASRNPSSKYDFVKVKVCLGDNADHYYVLSRFLLSRMLTVTKIPNHVAVKIALELKKLLIDNSLLDVSQSDLEANLFKLMERRGYGEDYINRYRMMTRFHHQRVPLVILVCGTACVGKSTIATQLAQRLNLPNVLQTDMVYELLRTSTDATLTSIPVWAREFSSPEELITEFCRECRIVRKGLAGDLKKAMKDGKPIIIEGIHLDPSIYLMDDESKSSGNMQDQVKEADPQSVASDDNKRQTDDDQTQTDDDQTQTDDNPSSISGTHNEHTKCEQHLDSQEVSANEVNKVSDSLEAIKLAGDSNDNEGDTHKDPEAGKNNPAKKEKSGGEPVIVPLVLKMAEFDHKALLEEWISTRTFKGESLIQEKDKLIANLKTIQDYLCSFKSQGLTVVNVSATTFPQTLDWLHGYLLQCIEQGISSASNTNGKTPEK